MIQEFLKQFSDTYERKARLLPMLCALAPVILLLVIYTPISINFGFKSVAALLLYAAASTLLSSFARRAGKANEEALKQEWGGWPSMIIFRHKDHTINDITKNNIHRAMSKMVVGTTSPTPALEAKDPAQADQIYQAWLEHLKKLARNDKKKYPHVFNENMSYGFHRNLYGLKPFAIIVLLCCVVISSGAAWHNWQQSKLFPKQDLICLGVFVCDLLFWVFCVSCAMVKQVAYEYAQRLIEDCVPEVKAARKPKEL